MKTYKIFVLPTHQTEDRTSGVDFARLIQPMQHFNGFETDDIKFEVHVYDATKDKKLDWLIVANKYDAVYFNYTANPWAFAAMGAMCRKSGIPMIMDMDDDLFDVPADNPAYNIYKKGSEGLRVFTAICNEVDYITCTNSYLRNAIIHNTNKTHDNVFCFDNYVDFDLYKYPQEFKDTEKITLTHFGSTSHFIDLQNKEFVKGIDLIMKDYPNVEFLTIGAFVPEFRKMWGMRYREEFGHRDIYSWISDRFPDVMKQTDICVIPLENYTYTRCKSAIKYLEMSSAKKPAVWQDIRQYSNVINNGVNGFLASSSKNWYDCIKNLIDNKELRKSMGESAYKDVYDNYQMKNNLQKYADFFTLVDSKFEKS
jgi:glycosyltransferase involved in cell wall biosynthesis